MSTLLPCCWLSQLAYICMLIWSDYSFVVNSLRPIAPSSSSRPRTGSPFGCSVSSKAVSRSHLSFQRHASEGASDAEDSSACSSYSDRYFRRKPASIKSRVVSRLSYALIGSSLLVGGASNAVVGQRSSSAATSLKASSLASLATSELTDEAFRNAKVAKRPSDRKEYRALRLSNQLRVLLISDKNTNRAAAAIDIHVGAFSDPEEVPGLAHFAEHMCFLGTEKYPDEADFGKFLGSHGGSSNAYTDTEDTVYFFDCNENYLEPALDRFAQFFVNPLFTPSATSRELNAIDSEHSKNINSDGFRFYQLEKDYANAEHPLSKFSTGNKQTLETDQKARGVDVRDELLKFHKKHYTSNQMTLCVSGAQDLNTLEKWVTSKFSDVPNNGENAPETEWWGKVRPYPVQEFATELQIVPVSESLRRLSVSWPIWIPTPELKSKWLDSKPETILAHLLGHEGAGSLRSWIVSKGWGNGVSCNVEIDIADMELFDVSVDLTEEGLKHRYEVVDAIFGYIDMLRSKDIPDYVVPEVAQVAKIGFQFSENRDPMSYTSSIAAEMQHFPPERYLTGSRLIENPNLEDVKSYLSNLVPEQAVVKTAATEFKGKTKLNARIYNTDYNQIDLKSETLKWKRTKFTDYPDLKYPAPNELIPTNFDLVGTPAKSESERTKALDEEPAILRNDTKWIVYHKTDRYFSQPKVYAIMALSLSEDLYNVDFAIRSRLFSYCFEDSLSEYSYDAALGGLNYAIEFTSKGLQITFSGYSDKLDVFAARILKELKSYRPTLKTFDRFKDILMRDALAWKSQQPYQHAGYFAGLYSETLQFSNKEMVDAIARSKVSDLDEFLSSVLRSSFGTALVVGNYDRDRTNKLVDLVDATFNFDALPLKKRSRRRCGLYNLPTCVDDKKICPVGYRLKNIEPNENDDNSASTFYFQVPSRAIEDYMMLELLAEVIDQPFYDDLRTKQQLGYIVGSGGKNREGVLSLALTAQSNIVDGEELTNRIETFLKDEFLPMIESISDEEFDSYKEGIISRLQEPDQRLTKQAGRYWDEVISSSVSSAIDREFDIPEFSRKYIEAEFTDGVKKADFIEFSKNILSQDGSNRRVLISQVTSNKNVRKRINGKAVHNYIDILEDPNKYQEGMQFI